MQSAIVCLNHLVCPYLGNITLSSLSKRQLLSWEDANEMCNNDLLQLSQRGHKLPNILKTNRETDNVHIFAQQNVSYWLGIHKHGNCQIETTELPQSRISQMQNIKCSYAKKNFTRIEFDNCSITKRPICIKTGNQD